MATPNPLSAREFVALPTSRVPFIPELHQDDCADVDCVRCEPVPQIAALDVPLPVVESQARQLAGCIAEQAHLLDPADPLFVRLVCEHDDCCSTDADYPNWTPGGQA